MASALSTPPASASCKQYAHSTMEVIPVKKRKQRRAKRKWRSSGDDKSSSSGSEKLVHTEDDIERTVKGKINPTRQTNCTYRSTDIQYRNTEYVDSREWLSEIVCTKQKRSHSKENMRYKSPSQVESCSHIVMGKIRKAPSVFELDVLSRSAGRITSNMLQTEEMMPDLDNGKIESELLIKKEDESDVSREMFLDAELIIGQGIPSSYFTTADNIKDVLSNPLLLSSSKKANSDDSSRSTSDMIYNNKNTNDIYQTSQESFNDEPQNKKNLNSVDNNFGIYS